MSLIASRRFTGSEVYDHTAIGYPWLVRHSPLVVDTRNVTKGMDRWKEKIVRA
jgi:UDP-N-acetyl-D-glucosamine dehydrogenase